MNSYDSFRRESKTDWAYGKSRGTLLEANTHRQSVVDVRAILRSFACYYPCTSGNEVRRVRANWPQTWRRRGLGSRLHAGRAYECRVPFTSGLVAQVVDFVGSMQKALGRRNPGWFGG